jgi:hypothetical protein
MPGTAITGGTTRHIEAAHRTEIGIRRGGLAERPLAPMQRSGKMRRDRILAEVRVRQAGLAEEAIPELAQEETGDQERAMPSAAGIVDRVQAMPSAAVVDRARAMPSAAVVDRVQAEDPVSAAPTE